MLEPAVTPQETPVVDEKIWAAWLAKTNLRERQTARRMKRVAQTVSALAAIAALVFYLMK